MKSMLASMAVVVTFCAAPAAAAEFPKTGSAEYDTYYVDNTLAKIDSGAGTGGQCHGNSDSFAVRRRLASSDETNIV